MSFRLLTTRLYKHGRLLVQCCFKRDIHFNILDNGRNRGIPSVDPGNQLLFRQARTTNGLLRFGSEARRIFVDNVLNRVTNPYSAELRTRAARRLVFGDSAPFFALVGVSLASGDGMLTRNDELEAICWEIRNAVAGFQNTSSEQAIEKRLDEELGLDALKIGPPLAKGCSAVVYAAAIKKDLEASATDDATVSTAQQSSSSSEANETFDFTAETEQLLSPVQNVNRYVHSFKGSIDNLHDPRRATARGEEPLLQFTSLAEAHRPEDDPKQESVEKKRVRFDSGNFAKQRSRLLSDAIEEYLELQTPEGSDLVAMLHQYNMDASLEQYPLALKMMFNYDIQSNAMAILKAMYKETVPAMRRPHPDVDSWENSLMERTVFLPPHPNVVEMYGVFCDQVPNLHMSASLYPMALPERINPQGFGRNMSLFLLMKRYNCSLIDYLSQSGEQLDMRTRILLFAQLLEAVAHLNRYGVAHRDLKSDNILIEIHPNMPPTLVLSDFGCCIADKHNGFQIPYPTSETDKGGNAALMAPEIISKKPGAFSVLNYSKSDLWACGAIAYEIFGSQNPFYASKNDPKTLKNENYKECDLPALDENVPLILRKLVENMLRRNPNERLSADLAANVVQLFLWSPSSWLKANFSPSGSEILQWLLSLTTKILCEGRLQVGTMGRRTYTEYLLISSFLARVRISRVRRALDWIYSVQ